MNIRSIKNVYYFIMINTCVGIRRETITIITIIAGYRIRLIFFVGRKNKKKKEIVLPEELDSLTAIPSSCPDISAARREFFKKFGQIFFRQKTERGADRTTPTYGTICATRRKRRHTSAVRVDARTGPCGYPVSQWPSVARKNVKRTRSRQNQNINNNIYSYIFFSHSFYFQIGSLRY